ncbi:MAG: 50S ribosomal protein L11 methyltransferase [Thermoleophilia bacterium]
MEAAPERIVRAFPALCALQPVRWAAAGLVCAPRAAPELAAAALAACPLPVRALATVPGWPDPPADWVAGWYRRGPGHVPAPVGVRELVQAPGEGFGPMAGHATTAMCLEAIDAAPAGRAVDAGCGSGLLAQAWARLGRGRVLAVDLDPRATEQAGRSLRLAGLAGRVEVRRGPIEALRRGDVARAVLLANVPAAAHRALAARIGDPPAAAVVSGVRPAEEAAVLAGYAGRGLRLQARVQRAGFVCLRLEA